MEGIMRNPQTIIKESRAKFEPFSWKRNASSVTLVVQMNPECAARRMLHLYLIIVGMFCRDIFGCIVNKFHF